MPIRVAADIRRMNEEEFKARAYEVMGHVFDVQRELGRLFHEKIFASRRPRLRRKSKYALESTCWARNECDWRRRASPSASPPWRRSGSTISRIIFIDC